MKHYSIESVLLGGFGASEMMLRLLMKTKLRGPESRRCRD